MRISVSTSVENEAPVSVLTGDPCCRIVESAIAESGKLAADETDVAVAGEGFSVFTDGLRFTGNALRASLTCGRLVMTVLAGWYPADGWCICVGGCMS